MIYLAYGSNLLPARLVARCSSAVLLGSVELPGWRLAFDKVGSDGSAKCDLVEAPGSLAHSALYELSDADKPVLDRIEGVGQGYAEHALALPGFGAAYMYRAEKGFIDPRLRPFRWYHRFVLEGARHHRFPAPYLASIASVVSTPDAERRAAAAAVMVAASGPD